MYTLIHLLLSLQAMFAKPTVRQFKRHSRFITWKLCYMGLMLLKTATYRASKATPTTYHKGSCTLTSKSVKNGLVTRDHFRNF